MKKKKFKTIYRLEPNNYLRGVLWKDRSYITTEKKNKKVMAKNKNIKKLYSIVKSTQYTILGYTQTLYDKSIS